VTGPTVSCPSCGARSVQTTNVKRSTVPKDLAAEYAAATGGAASDTIPQALCGRCGARWIPRTSQERQLKALSGQLGPEAMRAAQEAQAAAAAAAAPAPRAASGKKIPVRTWAIAIVMVIVILLAIFT